ncbi:uncharacterized protein [Ptychodera flava]|uniref:uncharacterized protein n=1 Tax=Ptychodera flava TaxID=63121 RepID=UPI003969DA24
MLQPGCQSPMYYNSTAQQKRYNPPCVKIVCRFLFAVIYILTNQVSLTQAEFGQCYQDNEEIVFEDELYATNGGSGSAWFPIPGVAIFIFMVIGIVIFSFGFSYLVREYLDACCEYCWSCGKGEKYDDDEEEEEIVKNDAADENPIEIIRLKSAKRRESRRIRKPDIERQESTLSEEPDELTWQVKVNEFLRDMPDGASVNHLYTDSLNRRASVISRIVNEKDRDTDHSAADTESRTTVAVMSARDGNRAGNETARSDAPSTVTSQPKSGILKHPSTTTPMASTSKAVQQPASSRPQTAGRNAPVVKVTTAQQSARPQTGTSRPTTAGRSSAVRPTTGQRTSKVSPERPRTRQSIRPPTIGRPATREGDDESTPVTPSSARKREQQKKFDDAWDQQQVVKALALDDEDDLQNAAGKSGTQQNGPPRSTSATSRKTTTPAPTSQEHTRETAKPLIGIRRPSQTVQQFKTTGRMTKSYSRKDSGISVSQKTESPVNEEDEAVPAKAAEMNNSDDQAHNTINR